MKFFTNYIIFFLWFFTKFSIPVYKKIFTKLRKKTIQLFQILKKLYVKFSISFVGFPKQFSTKFFKNSEYFPFFSLIFQQILNSGEEKYFCNVALSEVFFFRTTINHSLLASPSVVIPDGFLKNSRKRKNKQIQREIRFTSALIYMFPFHPKMENLFARRKDQNNPRFLTYYLEQKVFTFSSSLFPSNKRYLYI